MNGFFQALACVGAPVDCGLGWLDTQPAILVLLAGVVIGMIAGSLMGKAAVFAVLTLGAGLFFIGRRSKDDDEMFWNEDPKPVRRSSQKPPKGKVTRTVLTTGPLADFLKRLGRK